jgi:hypothetical protein
VRVDEENFKQPPSRFREVPFWSWNDRLEGHELERQIELFAQGGWGGFFMHARVGLRTAYLGREWLECVQTCLDTAQRHGLKAWLYDEDKYPSGFAGGLAVSKPAFRAKHLVCHLTDKPVLLDERIAMFKAREHQGQPLEFTPCEFPELSKDERVVQFYVRTLPLGMSWYAGTTYLDTLYPEAVCAFLESTHELYARRFSQHFGDAVPGIFTDEPSMTIPLFEDGEARRFTLPWTTGFELLFQERNGYELLEHLPSLFFDTGDFYKIRHDFWQTLSERFLESYTKQVGSWCERNKLVFTGHFLGEDTLESQIAPNGSVMPQYRHMGQPGVDNLGRQINAEPGSLLAMKQLDSVVCQAGKARALCESYGAAGQGLTLAGRKWLADWQFVLGITASNPHLAPYSLRGRRKRDYPPALSFQQPWWPDNVLIADYMARLSYALSQGKRVVDVLVLHPVRSAWCVYRPGSSPALRALDKSLSDVLTTLMNGQRDFHLGDEALLAEGETKARVEIIEEKPHWGVGAMAYKVVIVPPSITLARTTVEALEIFVERGGTVLALEPQPTRIDGEETKGQVLPHAVQTTTLASLLHDLDNYCPFDVRIPDQPHIWVHHRQVDETTDLYFVANSELEAKHNVTLHLRGGGRFEVWDPKTGEITPLASTVAEDISTLVLDFHSATSYLIVRHRNETPVVAEAHTYAREIETLDLDGAWQIETENLNALLLDEGRISLEAGAWSEIMPIFKLQDAVTKAGTGTRFKLQLEFKVDVVPSTPVFLVLESPEIFTCHLNNKPLSMVEGGWWLDPSFRKLEISSLLQLGTNRLELQGIVSSLTELENLYLIGEFGVSLNRVGFENDFNGQRFDRYTPNRSMIAMTRKLEPLSQSEPHYDLTGQGFPFFAGRVRLLYEAHLPKLYEKAFLEIVKPHAAVMHVYVNGSKVGTLAWEPYRLEVGKYLREGSNTVELELAGTLRNLFGPHHLAGGDLAWTGPAQFSDPERWTRDVILSPFGFARVSLGLESR